MRSLFTARDKAAVPEGAPYSWRFFCRPGDVWEAMYRDCEAAKESIEFEQYIIENDAVGKRFLKLFIRKARAGLKVFIICDTYGSMLLSRSPLIRSLRRHGGRVHFYNDTISRLTVLTPWRLFPRTHTKTLLIDSKIAYTGGVCMDARMRDWRDTHLRVTGPVVGQIRRAFDDIENRILHRRSPGVADAGGDRRFLYVLTRPFQQRFAVYREFLRAIDEAKDYIYITSAYFVPNRRFIWHLKRARARGVDVRVIVPGASDVLPADWLRLSYTPRYLRAGLRIFHYQKTILHSKTAIIDDRWGTVGSTNFDIISFFRNREANIVTTDREAIAELKRQFFCDLQDCIELTPGLWKKIPLWKKALGYGARVLKVFI